jgi:P4 family phage/plasmid primase-like protien
MSSKQTKLNPNKVLKVRTKLEKLLDRNRVIDGNNNSITHISMNPCFPGKYSFDKSSRKKLNKLVKETNKLDINFSIGEKPQQYGPIKVDIDLEMPKDNQTGKLYDNDLVLQLIDMYRNAINKYLDPQQSELSCYVLEKEGTSAINSDLIIKDGIHLFFPFLNCHFKVRHLIREFVVNQAKEQNIFDNYSKCAEDIIDKSIISSNFWLMYGNSKPKSNPYKLTQVIAHDDSELDLPETNEELVDLFSLQSKHWKASNATTLNAELSEEDINMECEMKGINNSTTTQIDQLLPVNSEEEIRKAKFLVSLLADERAENYHDWMRVGWSLFNTDPSLIEVWIEFSKKCPEKFNEQTCRKKWKETQQRNRKGLTIRSIQYWAKEDNPRKYAEYMKAEFLEKLERSTTGDTYSIAKALYTKYFDRFVCASIRHNSWFEFRTHKWNKIDGGFALMRIISEEFLQEYFLLNSQYNIKAAEATSKSSTEVQILKNKTKSIQNVIDKLSNLNFKKQIMEECKYLFYDDEFEEKLDENHDLLGCTNGVYDFAKSEFRPGRPDDYITLSTNNNYIAWNPKNPYAKSIEKFFSEILPKKPVRDYFLQALCTCLTGHNREEKLYIPTGGGSNGKSLTFEVVNLALGEYYISCPVTIMTRGRGASGQASPELARLKGKRCGVLQEPDNNETMNVGLMKELTGNDAFMARGLFEDPKEIKPQIKFFLTCNDLPMIPSRDGGTWRRLRVIQFLSKFTDNPKGPREFEIDTRLKEKIQAWGPSFLSYLVYVYNTQYKDVEYLKAPTEVEYSTNAYKADNDHFQEYFENKLEKVEDTKCTISKRNVYSDFKAWFKDCHETKKLPRSDQLYKYLDEVLGSHTRYGWKNVMFRTEEGDDDSDQEVNDLDV